MTVYLANLRPHRLRTTLTRKQLRAITAIRERRIEELEKSRVEPWFDEALRIARALNIAIGDMLAPAEVAALDRDPRFYPNDVGAWRAGARIPLRVALRLQARFGLPTVDDLATTALSRQIWDMVHDTHRHPEAPGWCPWCGSDIVGGSPHAETCLPNNLWGTDATDEIPDAEPDRPGPLRRRTRQSGAPAHGLRHLRMELGLTQAQLADKIGCSSNHLARVERCDLPLTLTIAERMVDLLGVSRERIYTAPEVSGSPDPDVSGTSTDPQIGGPTTPTPD